MIYCSTVLKYFLLGGCQIFLLFNLYSLKKKREKKVYALCVPPVQQLSAVVINLRFPSVYHFNNLTGKFIALIPCTVPHGKRFEGNILSLYAI